VVADVPRGLREDGVGVKEAERAVASEGPCLLAPIPQRRGPQKFGATRTFQRPQPRVPTAPGRPSSPKAQWRAQGGFSSQPRWRCDSLSLDERQAGRGNALDRHPDRRRHGPSGTDSSYAWGGVALRSRFAWEAAGWSRGRLAIASRLNRKRTPSRAPRERFAALPSGDVLVAVDQRRPRSAMRDDENRGLAQPPPVKKPIAVTEFPDGVV